jgi:ribonuclease Z
VFRYLTYIQQGKKITFILDTKLNPNISKISKNSDILIAESTYSSEDKEIASEYYHLTSEQAAKTALKAKAKKLYLIHISQRYEKNHNKILKQARKIFPATFIAQDLMKILV